MSLFKTNWLARKRKVLFGYEGDRDHSFDLMLTGHINVGDVALAQEVIESLSGSPRDRLTAGDKLLEALRHQRCGI